MRYALKANHHKRTLGNTLMCVFLCALGITFLHSLISLISQSANKTVKYAVISPAKHYNVIASATKACNPTTKIARYYHENTTSLAHPYHW